MEQSERYLSFVYSFIIVLAFICSVCSAVAWNHWKFVLDTCVEVNCGCILNAEATRSVFTGGHVLNCHWAVYGLLIPLIFSMCLGVYHIFRVCCMSSKPRSETRKMRSGEVIVMTSRTELAEESSIPYYWIPAAVISAFFTVYTLVHAIMYTVGYYRTCNQFRQELIKTLNAAGNEVAVIQGRLSCTAIYDFMDYLHKDYSHERRRENHINTSAALTIALVSTWFTFLLWTVALIINIVQSRANRSVRV